MNSLLISGLGRFVNNFIFVFSIGTKTDVWSFTRLQRKLLDFNTCVGWRFVTVSRRGKLTFYIYHSGWKNIWNITNLLKKDEVIDRTVCKIASRFQLIWPKGQCDLLSSICVCRLLSGNISHFNLFLRNQWIKWNQTWEECYLDRL